MADPVVDIGERFVDNQCSGCLGDWYTGLGAKIMAPKKHFSSFLFSVVFQQKICWSSYQQFHSASNYFEMA